MIRVCVASLCVLALAFSLTFAKPVRGPKPPDFSKLKPESIAKWGGAEVLVAGKLVSAVAGPVALSEPPIYSYRMQIQTDKILRGAGTVKKMTQAGYSIKQKDRPTFPGPDQDCLIAMKFVRGSWVVQSVELATADNLEQAQLATSFPMGWTLKDEKLVSPWAAVGKPGKAEGVACTVTGRPVLLVGDGVSFSAEPVPPAVKFEFKNPDGDGDYKLTVKNLGDKEIEVPALLTDGKEIRWNDCLVILCQGKTYPIPGSTGSIAGLKSVVLKPGESVSGVAHVFALQGPQWPMGGDRVEFQFCLGEKSATQSFYYHSKHHDPIRAAVLMALKK